MTTYKGYPVPLKSENKFKSVFLASENTPDNRLMDYRHINIPPIRNSRPIRDYPIGGPPSETNCPLICLVCFVFGIAFGTRAK